VGYDILDDLIGTGDLDAAVRDEMPTFDLRSTTIEWNAADGERCFPARRQGVAP
jgi:hypothetical protein